MVVENGLGAAVCERSRLKESDIATLGQFLRISIERKILMPHRTT